ncbi:MAG: hypothetical protein AB1659_01200, partial [Thermodesulfobacteriota bacterium]
GRGFFNKRIFICKGRGWWLISAENMKNLFRRKKVSTEIKFCPNCGIELPLRAKECFSCHTKVGKRDRFGRAKRPIDWIAYATCIISWLVLIVYCWWAFFRK